jgi:hypothetical protein
MVHRPSVYRHPEDVSWLSYAGGVHFRMDSKYSSY